MGRDRGPTIDEIVAALEDHFRARVVKITAPGGKRRASFRAYFADRTVIVTYRPNRLRTQLEALVLQALAPHCDAVPKFLGQRGDLLFQSDAGERRLSQAARDAEPGDRLELATEAVAAIFRIHAGARKTDLLAKVPHLGATPAWVGAVVDSVDDLAGYLGRAAPELDRAAICEGMRQPAAQVLKWDCRSGNAALDAAGKLRWFDFEYSGARHGAEDFAWLIADEVWSVPCEDMLAAVGDAFDPGSGHTRDAYLDYLALYTAFHAIQRIKLVVGEARRRGWTAQQRAVRYDKVGTHPALGARLAETGAVCADRNAATRPLVGVFEDVARMFRDTIEAGAAKPAA